MDTCTRTLPLSFCEALSYLRTLPTCRLSRAGLIAQLRKHEAMSLVFNTHRETLGLVVCACYPSIGEVETDRCLRAPWLSVLDYSASSKPNL